MPPVLKPIAREKNFEPVIGKPLQNKERVLRYTRPEVGKRKEGPNGMLIAAVGILAAGVAVVASGGRKKPDMDINKSVKIQAAIAPSRPNTVRL